MPKRICPKCEERVIPHDRPGWLWCQSCSWMGPVDEAHFGVNLDATPAPEAARVNCPIFPGHGFLRTDGADPYCPVCRAYFTSGDNPRPIFGDWKPSTNEEASMDAVVLAIGRAFERLADFAETTSQDDIARETLADHALVAKWLNATRPRERRHEAALRACYAMAQGNPNALRLAQEAIARDKAEREERGHPRDGREAAEKALRAIAEAINVREAARAQRLAREALMARGTHVSQTGRVGAYPWTGGLKAE